MWPAALKTERIGMSLALVALVCLGAGLVLSKGQQFLMPGPLTSAHGAIEKCSACHTKSGSNKVSWIHGLVPGDRLADSKACLTCHKISDTAFNAHGASSAVLKSSAERLTKIAAATPQPQSARAQNAVVPTHDMVAGGLACASCHQEHKGADFKLSVISNEQCRSCHAVKFDSFDGHHPKFEAYPFKRRTRIIYDHAGHFGKHYPELAKKDPAKRAPETCSTCHNSRDDKRVMAVAPFDQTCATCHLDQIIGKERATGPKGIAFLSLPGLDLETLRKKNVAIGEWPDGSEAELTPFMKVMIGRSDQGRALIKAVDGLNLQDLSKASDAQLKAVGGLVRQIKELIHALIKGKASDVLGDLNIVSGAKLSPGLVADLTASIPRDVVASAQQQWLPNLATEIATGPITGNPQPAIRGTDQADPDQTTDTKSPESDTSDEPSKSDATEGAASDSKEASGKAAAVNKRDPPPCLVHLFGQCLMEKEPPPTQSEKTAPPGSDKASPSAGILPEPMRAGLADAGPASGEKMLIAQASPPAKTGDQSDDLLFPSEDELRAMKDRAKTGEKAPVDDGAPRAGAAAAPDARAQKSQPTAPPVIAIESDVDPESWAEYGGWYRQDFTVFYRPVGHKDKFIYAWLFLTGPQAPKGGTSPAAAVFNSLTIKDAQGGCTKCHSVDDIAGKGRLVNFSPSSHKTKEGRFTHFIHEPHFGLLETRGCMSCHDLEKGRPYLKSFEQGNPLEFVSSFGAVKKDVCQSCHAANKARQDCLLCHDYHVNGVVTPIMSTKIPNQ